MYSEISTRRCVEHPEGLLTSADEMSIGQQQHTSFAANKRYQQQQLVVDPVELRPPLLFRSSFGGPERVVWPFLGLDLFHGNY